SHFTSFDCISCMFICIYLDCLLCKFTAYAFSFFFFNDPPTSDIYSLSLHDALPISSDISQRSYQLQEVASGFRLQVRSYYAPWVDRKSTRLNSSHVSISYAVFCLQKK